MDNLIYVGVVASAMAMRVGLREVLNTLPGVRVVAEAATLKELSAPDMDVLVVVGLPDPAALERMTAVLLLTDDPADARILFDLPLAARGLLPVDAGEDELGAALHALGEGLWVGAPILVRDTLSPKPGPVPAGGEYTGEPLTARETEVLQLTAQGLANKQIAVALNISEHTVKFHLSSLYAKLGVTSRMEAVRAGARRGLVVL
jgi:DNA-binding NarL/FixJ family response regulator